MAYRFNQDLLQVRRLMAWIEWRIDALKDHQQLPGLVVLVRGHLEEVRENFHQNPFQHSMVEEAKRFGNSLLKGVADSICSKTMEVFKAECAYKVGKEMEAVMYVGLCEDYASLHLAIELFFLARDFDKTFKLCQSYSYGFGYENKYDVKTLRASVEKMEWTSRGMAPLKNPAVPVRF